LAGRRRPAARITAATVAVATLAVVTGCGDAGSRDPLQVADVLSAAEPATSPQVRATPAGRVLPLDGHAGATVVEPVNRVLAVAVTGPDRVLLYDMAALADGAGEPTRTVPLPGPAEQLDLGVAGEVLVPVRGAGVVVRIGTGRDQNVTTVTLSGGPVAAAVAADRLVVALADDRAVAVLDSDRVVHTVPGLAGAADLVAVGARVVVIDRLRTAIATVDPVTGNQGPALRAGDGATNAAGDRYGRVLVTDTRGGELLAFTAEPMIMRQRYPVPGAPYAIAYDAERDLAWVTLTERNEVVGFDVAGGEPVERYRLATVRQPDAVAVDSGSGAVVVVSGTGEGMQVVTP
jgi:hypothetical protein